MVFPCLYYAFNAIRSKESYILECDAFLAVNDENDGPFVGLRDLLIGALLFSISVLSLFRYRSWIRQLREHEDRPEYQRRVNLN